MCEVLYGRHSYQIAIWTNRHRHEHLVQIGSLIDLRKGKNASFIVILEKLFETAQLFKTLIISESYFVRGSGY